MLFNPIEIKNGYVIEDENGSKLMYMDGFLYNRYLQKAVLTLDNDKMIINSDDKKTWKIKHVYDRPESLLNSCYESIWRRVNWQKVKKGTPVAVWNSNKPNVKTVRLFGGISEDDNSFITYATYDSDNGYGDIEIYEYCEPIKDNIFIEDIMF